MKFLHLGDLHIGKKVNGFDMLNDQKFVLKQAISVIESKKIDCVLIAGDVFDRTIPTIFALNAFSDFLNSLSELNVKVCIISGNHDSAQRLSFLSSFLEKSNIFISKPFDGKIEYVDFYDNCRIYLLPYIYPALIRAYFPDAEITNYNDAFKVVLDNTQVDANKTNIILAHQFVAGCDELILSQNEQKSVGTVEVLSYKLFEKFDYTALGHLHCAQKVGMDKIRYSGSILKYSFSELSQKKFFTILNIEKNNFELEFIDIEPLHDLKEYKGYLSEFLNKEFYKNVKTDDYIHFILQDEYVLEAKKKLSLVYPNIMLLEFDNSFTKALNTEYSKTGIKDLSFGEHFEKFYKNQLEVELDFQKEKIINKLINEIRGDVCAP